MTHPLSILYVDDDDDIRTIATMALGLDPAISVEAAGSASEALALVEARATAPDVMLLDVMMPDTDGPTLAHALRQRADYAAVPVIFITARARPGDMEHYRRLGAAGVLAKPFNPMTLPDQIREILAAA